MSESGDEDRTEAPSEKRLREARERGDVPRSRDATAVAILLGGGAVLSLWGAPSAQHWGDWMRQALSLSGEDVLALSLPLALSKLLLTGFALVAPVLAACLLAALLAPNLLGGWNFSVQALQPDLSRLDPIQGFSRMFSSRGLVELTKSLAKFALVAAAGALLLWQSRQQWMGLSLEPGASGIGHAAGLCVQAFLALALVLGLIAVIDAPYQWWSWHRRLRMTREELRREARESEGQPEVRARLRRLQQEAARHRMMEAVPKADVIVVNPVHFAIALRYDASRMRAPRVVAKGAGLVAERIRDLARQHHVPILAAPPLARVLYRATGIGDEIPAALYAAVAQVLTWVFRLRRNAGGPPPEAPVIDIPQGLPEAPLPDVHEGENP